MLEPDKRQISSFNEAALQIQRLHNIWSECRKARESGNFKKLRWLLDSAYIELLVDIHKLEGDYEKNIKELDKKIKITMNNQDIRIVCVEIYPLLLEKEGLLREVQDESGKGGHYRDADADDMD